MFPLPFTALLYLPVCGPDRASALGPELASVLASMTSAQARADQRRRRYGPPASGVASCGEGRGGRQAAAGAEVGGQAQVVR